MIESRPDLIDALTSENRDGIGRGLDELQFIAAVRMLDDYIRLTLGVVLVNIPYCENVLLCPGQFKIGRFHPSHPPNLAQSVGRSVAGPRFSPDYWVMSSPSPRWRLQRQSYEASQNR